MVKFDMIDFGVATLLPTLQKVGEVQCRTFLKRLAELELVSAAVSCPKGRFVFYRAFTTQGEIRERVFGRSPEPPPERQALG